MRADAKRNYDRLVEVAREVFREQGYDASLDEVARRAGVGPGTLYRHFPTRDALLDAIMQSWVARVEEAAEKALAHEGPPRERLLAWLEQYVALISVHKGGPAKITSAMGNPDSPINTKCQVLTRASDRVLPAPRRGSAPRGRRDAPGDPAGRRGRDDRRHRRPRRRLRATAARSGRRRSGAIAALRGTPFRWTP